ncbi:MAG: Wzt carbohydrate-binding domain-containing protein [Candidatus Moranbacteria bacterium]|nr:Wzt carbohydrate-binding domain-containing protein [Candidatus Moranbacteria bacterium]
MNPERDSIAIEVKNVSKTFRIPHEKISSLRGAFVNLFHSNGFEEFKALDNVSFQVKKGEFFGIIGRNGSGKSTLLKILAGIYKPDTPVKYAKGSRPKGEFHGVKINGLISPFLELGIGFNPELSGRDNIYLNAAVLGLSHKQIDEKFDDIVEFSELRRFIDQKVKNYSSGMQVRLAFSVAIHANRDILLMDEVLAVGDTNFQSKCLEEFNKYKDAGKTVILVTHDIATVQRYCDRAMLLRNGKIEMVGDPQEVGNKYIYQNMSDEEKRILDEEKRQRIKAEKENERLAQEQKKSEQRQRTEEEKRQQEEKRRKEEEKRNKIAEITKVDFLDKNGNVRNVFQTGDDIVARIHIEAFKKIKNPVVGIAIHTQDGIQISGPNTKSSKYLIGEINGHGQIEFSILENSFFSGNYFLTVALYNWECKTPFDYLDKKFSFKIQCTEENQFGLFKLKHLWRKV